MGLEPDSVVQLLLRERLRIVAAAAAIVRDVHAADDLFQQVVLSALEHRSRIRDADHLLAWSLRTARHRAVDLARRKQLRPLSTEVLDLFEADWGDPAGSGGPDREEALRRCVGRLGAPARDLLRMKYFEGLTAVAIAAKLRRTADAVYQSLSRLHRSLRDCVEHEQARQPVAGVEGGRP
jgi:RNA polymerase sigma-70 factor (ECF subfamily)